MTATPTALVRPTPLSRVWSRERVLAEDLQGEDLGDVLELHADASAWWVLPRQDDHPNAQLRGAADALDLDRLVVSDLTAEDHRATFEEIGPTRLVLTNAVSVDPDGVAVTAHPVSLVVTDRVLICLVDPMCRVFDPAALLTARADVLTTGGVDMALHLVLAAVVGTYEQAVGWLEDASDGLAEALFEERPLNRTEQLRAFRLRAALSQLRRLTDPMKTVVIELVDALPDDDSLQARHWRMLRDRQLRVAAATDGLREALSSVFDTSLALADQQANVIMKKLAGWAAIIAVPTLVTGFAGMNVAFPLDGTRAGFWLSLAIMIVSVVALYGVFRRRGWI